MLPGLTGPRRLVVEAALELNFALEGE
jgi:hypothetical protein